MKTDQREAAMLLARDALQFAEQVIEQWPLEKQVRHLREQIVLALKHLNDRAINRAACDVLAERQRQISEEGWTPEHDDQYQNGELVSAAACYALSNEDIGEPPAQWPWAPEWWKPTDYRRGLIKSAALLLAEIERLDRAESKEKGQ